MKNKPGDINDDGLEIEQDGWITRLNKEVISDNKEEGGKDEE